MPFLQNDKVRKAMIDHIKIQAAMKKFHLIEMNGWYEHLHALVQLRTSQRIQDIAQHLKGESSRWISQKMGLSSFEWQKNYHVESVGKSELKRVQVYIQNQEIHHGKQG